MLCSLDHPRASRLVFCMRATIRLAAMASCLTLALAGSASSLEYSCPADPGFCYLDVEDDGCFDAGTDAGPIDAALEAGEFPSPLPPGDALPTAPGGIVCPPSVRRLNLVGAGTDWRTAPGSDIVLHAAQLVVLHFGPIELYSGGDLVMSSAIRRVIHNGFQPVHLRGEGDVVFAGLRARGSNGLEVESVSGNVTVAAKAKIAAATIFGTSPVFRAAQDVIFEEKISTNRRLEIHAGRDLFFDDPRFKTKGATSGGFWATARHVATTGKLRLGSDASIDIIASGDVTIEKLVTGPSLSLHVTADTISLGGPSSPSKTSASGTLLATTSLRVQKLRAKPSPTLRFEVLGTDLWVTDGSFKTAGGLAGTVDVVGGTGSTCDLTGTTFEPVYLATSCTTVVGP